MYFITETELRMNYRRAHFTEYKMERGTRLTPEARQFLLDRNIPIFDRKKMKPLPKKTESEKPNCRKLSTYLKPKLEKLSASFLLIISFLTDEDMYTAEKVMILSNTLNNLCNEDGKMLEHLSDTAKKPEQKHTISAFHIQSSRGKEIALLHFLLADLNLFRAELIEKSYEEEETEKAQLLLIEQKLQLMCTVLEELIHKAIGGKE
ncbi:hypothetical protein [Candidatus Enterococcus clewellii]|uniref:Uncharacterized protein n=1 Tax=Candidatus Enterococcus clewellii TaxID=1834193 RepID=A0A242KCA2_9ENTE|nr:hypothetical protein [Enterococcus sp. 9E7_DIV0242]OTP18699.1 hypothetical protein A5888_000513 [Enterococcus sp. 9E7_DIV0242]